MRKEGLFLWFFLLMLSFFVDEAVLNFIQGLRFSSLDLLMEGISSIIFLIIFILTCSYLLKDKLKIFYFWIGTGTSYGISLILKYLIQRPRPFDFEGFGFPSSHATVYFFIFAFMFEEKKLFGEITVKWVFLGLAVLVSFSRLYLGVHYLSDVITGGLLGVGLYLGGKKWLKN